MTARSIKIPPSASLVFSNHKRRQVFYQLALHVGGQPKIDGQPATAPFWLRHAHASHAIAEAPITLVSQTLGHADLKTMRSARTISGAGVRVNCDFSIAIALASERTPSHLSSVL
jgi:site-specific recombinase XerD